MKKIFPLFFVILTNAFFAQNKQILYDFAELPQTLLLNPGAETNYKYHIGVPLLSGFSAELGSTGFVLRDFFDNNTVPFNDKVSAVLNKLSVTDHLKFNTQIEIINIGYRYREKIYFSFGFYEEIDAIGYYPKDIITLATEGNSPYINRSFNISQINYNIDAIGVLHFGFSKRVNENLTLGGRFKLYSSALNMQSKNNSGTFTTVLGKNNIYTHYLDNLNVDFKTSGLVEDNEIIKEASSYLSNTFFGSNLGIGLDFGITHKINKQLEFSASIIDFGFIRHKKNIKNTTAKGSYTFEGLNFEFNASNPNYWNELDTDFREKVSFGDNNNSYITWRPTKFNASLKYSFGRVRSKYCYDSTFKNFYRNAVGAQLYSVFRPLGPQLALTGFYQSAISDKFQVKVTYTLDQYSFYNLGLGLSTQIGKINFYGMIDNLTQINDIASANGLSLQFGFNLIFN
ncbi:DUF5723 family protein [Polaribacter aquimarinus]|uniref:DUF5723 domain-containing protein n=1 Tax=Polaribacter aquimarinus TaxID=2100726 RepID=A0A2U2JDW9_9FLAO|nr:DUF5723 family protein [Polaribacter aquimarinus]PWG06538.1 hypothetical protein DIS07_01510 [Polaribacter aquimarinus]